MSEKSPTIEKKRTKTSEEITQQIGRISSKLIERAQELPATTGSDRREYRKAQGADNTEITTVVKDQEPRTFGKATEAQSLYIDETPSDKTKKLTFISTKKELDDTHGNSTVRKTEVYGDFAPRVDVSRQVTVMPGATSKDQLHSRQKVEINGQAVNEVDQISTNSPEQVVSESAQMLMNARNHIAKAENQQK